MELRNLLFSEEKLSVPDGFIGGAIVCIEGTAICGYPCCPWISEGIPFCMAGDDEADANLGPTDEREADLCFVS
jgi:hypothetical protein